MALLMKPWWIIAISFIVEIVALALCIFSAAAGHGSYKPAMIFFPYTMLSTSVFNSITRPFIIMALVQFPIYGIVLTLAHYKERLEFAGVCLLGFHSLAVGGSLIFASPNFR